MRRWLLWTLRCRRGRRCADLVVSNMDAPAGMRFRATYTCGGCGTHYSMIAMSVGDSTWVSDDRRRVA